jgi:hypothetical protein
MSTIDFLAQNIAFLSQCLRHRISAIDSNQNYKIDLLQALRFLRRAWDSVKPETIERCFRKAGFVIDDELVNISETEVEAQDEELNNLWETLHKNGEVEGELDDYLDVDKELVTAGGALTADEIVAICSRNEHEEEVNDSPTDEVEIEEQNLPAVSDQEASEALQILQRYNDRIGNRKMQKSCDIIDDVLSEQRLKNMKQKNIVDYFSVTEK